MWDKFLEIIFLKSLLEKSYVAIYAKLIKDLGLDKKFRDGFDAKEIAENIVKKLKNKSS